MHTYSIPDPIPVRVPIHTGPYWIDVTEQNAQDRDAFRRTADTILGWYGCDGWMLIKPGTDGIDARTDFVRPNFMIHLAQQYRYRFEPIDGPHPSYPVPPWRENLHAPRICGLYWIDASALDFGTDIVKGVLGDEWSIGDRVFSTDEMEDLVQKHKYRIRFATRFPGDEIDLS